MLLMATGVVLPSLWLAPVTIAIAALLVGSTFMVVTMIGMQEARARAPGNPTALLGLMTAAFAIGQLAGPVVSGVLDLLPGGHRAALGHALQLAAFALALSAAYLWSRSRPSPEQRANGMTGPAEGRQPSTKALTPQTFPGQNAPPIWPSPSPPRSRGRAAEPS